MTGGRAMHSFLGFLGTVILFVKMINYAHADTGREDAERLQAKVPIASEVESSSLGLAHRDSTQGDREIEAATERTDNAWMIDSSRVEHIQAILDSLSMEMARGDGKRINKEKDKRISQKMMSGTLTGILVGIGAGAAVLALDDTDCSDDFGNLSFACARQGRAVILGLFVYPAGVAVGVHRVDPHDRFIPTLAGSVAGFLTGALNPVLILLGPPIFSTLASERWRKPSDSSHRFSLGLAPDRWGGLSTVATLRF